MGKRSTRQEVNQREQDIADYLLRYPMASDFDLHKEFIPRYNVVWQMINAYASRARQINKKRLDMNQQDWKTLGQSVLLDLIKSPSPMIRLKAEQSLRDIAGYGAPKQVEMGGLQDKPLRFVPLTVDPGEVTGGK